MLLLVACRLHERHRLEDDKEESCGEIRLIWIGTGSTCI